METDADGRIQRLQQLYASLLKAKDRDIAQLRQQNTALRAQADVCRDQIQTLQQLLQALGAPPDMCQPTLGASRRVFDLAATKSRLTQVPWARVLMLSSDPSLLIWHVFAWLLDVDALHPRTSPLMWASPDTFKVFALQPGTHVPAWKTLNWMDLLGPIMRHCDDALANSAAATGAGASRTLRETNRSLQLQLQRLFDEHMERRGLVDRVPIEVWDTPPPAGNAAPAPTGYRA